MGLTFSFSQGCSAQDAPSPADRKPAVAGRFYPGDAQSLQATLKELFSNTGPRQPADVAAVICPHAGYVFSGQVAAEGYNQVDPAKKYANVFVLASSHHLSFPGASIYNRGDYITPLGKVPVNKEIAAKLIGEHSFFTFHPDADKEEHSLEVQIPFLQYHLKQPFRLVPIVLATQSAETCRKIAAALKPYFNAENLFVISTDFSHYPAYDDAVAADKATCDAITANDPDKLLKTLEIWRKKPVANLSTNLCGWTSVLTLLYMTTGDPMVKFRPLRYMNSGDSRYGDHRQVVGYWALAVTREPAASLGDGFGFSAEEKRQLLTIARNTVEEYVRNRRIPVPDTTLFTPGMMMKAGAFVTLKKNGNLRGCIGRFTSDQPLYKVIQQMAVASATEDSRFSPVSADELKKLEVEISVLSPMKRITSADEIVLGRHGIYIKKGFSSGTFLPQVATETGWTLEEFLGHCARDKAGIGWDGWKTAELYTYEACVFGEHELSGRKQP